MASSSSLYERKFTSKWLCDPRFSGWLSRSPYNPNKAYCLLCERELAGSVTFLERHRSTNKHRSLAQSHSNRQEQGSRQQPSTNTSAFISEKIAEWKIACYVLREGFPLSTVSSLSSLVKSLSPKQPMSLSQPRATAILRSLGQYHRKKFLQDTLKRTHFSIIFSGTKTLIRYLDPISKDICTAHFPREDPEVLRLTHWPHLVSTLNAPPTLDLPIPDSALRMESLEGRIEDITASALQALPPDCIASSWEIAKFISVKKTEHFKEFRDLIRRKGILSDRNLLKGSGEGVSLEEIVEFISSNWSSLMFWLASLELIEESSSFLQGLYDNPSSELYFAFLNYVLPCLGRMKAEFLCGDFRLHRLKASLTNSMRSILQNFMDPNLISLDKAEGQGRDSYLGMKDVFRGTMTSEILKKRDPTQVEEDFYFKTFNFYVHLEKGLLEHFSSSSSGAWAALNHFEALDPYNALRGNPGSLSDLGSRFPSLVPSMEKLNQEWRDLQSHREDKRFTEAAATFPEDFWKVVAAERIGSSPRFPLLSDLALSLLTISHSSIACLSFREEAEDIQSKSREDPSLVPLLLLAKDYLRHTNASWEPPSPLINAELDL